jgi:hypothetical protein
MAKNAFAKKLFQQKENAFADGMWSGLRMGLNLAAIALNHTFGFGESRLKRLEGKVQELIDEIVITNDPVVTEARIEKALKQIRGKAWECDG